MSKKNYDELATDIIEKVGGKENISRVTHCATRLRFSVKDNGIVDLDGIKKLDVFGAQFSGDQFQVIIGNDVSVVYDAVNSKLDLNESTTSENGSEQTAAKKEYSFKKIVAAMIDAIVASIVPIVPVLAGAGVLKAIVLLIEQFGWMTADAPTLVTLTWAADTAFYFFPIYIGVFAAKKFKVSVPMAMLVCAMLLHPTFVTMATAGNAGSIFGLPIYATTYSSTVIPAILAVWVMKYVEMFVRKITPSPLRIIFEPLLTFTIMIPLTLCILGPAGAILSTGFASALVAFHNFAGPLASALLCTFIPFIVMTGLHFGLIPLMITSISSTGSDAFVHPALMLSNFAQGAACLAVGVKTKNVKRKTLAFSCAFSDLIPGISEPGMYGITLRYKTPMYAAMIGCFVGGLYLGIMNVAAYQFAPPSIFSLALYASQVNPSSITNMIIGVVIAMIVTFIAGIFLFKDDAADKLDA